MSLIQSQNLNLIFDAKDNKVQALADINIEINKGDFVSFIGPSGCGKTSLLRIIADLERPSSGDLNIAGCSPNDYRKKKHYGYVFQAPAFILGEQLRKMCSFL